MAELRTKAEIAAKRATELPGFNNFALAGVKDKVEELASQIGRIEGIFSTYTKHDISHIDTMLGLLDWLVPEDTQKVMTPVDWLLIVLSIYFHDLGMVVTKEEYERRMENAGFNLFLHKLRNDPDSRDYLARASSMEEQEQERFFYQEFVRLHHAARIREWITGQIPHYYGDTIKPMTDAIRTEVDRLPSRFCDDLAIVCESHHKDDLDSAERYPLYQKYGTSDQETANVQYAAILLRTADLIHVTKDRTPSVMYKIIGLSDPKGVDEWKKQMATFSVGKKGRTFDPEALKDHVIEIDADFTEERPYFALSEYLVWADNQISQSKKWADRSRENADAKDFWFPWYSVKGKLRVEGNEPQPIRFEFDRGKLLNLLVGHTIYNDPKVAVRELLQNSIDAVRYQEYLDNKQAQKEQTQSPGIGNVKVEWNPQTRELIVQDNGTGMDREVIASHLMKVGSSFYDTNQFLAANGGFTAISRFGIGILTSFMISDDIEIVTCKNQSGHRVRMTSVHADYLLKSLPIGDKALAGLEPHGTRIRLKVRSSVNLEQNDVLSILRYWILLPACPVRYQEYGQEEVSIGFTDVKSALHYLSDDNTNLMDVDVQEDILVANNYKAPSTPSR